MTTNLNKKITTLRIAAALTWVLLTMTLSALPLTIAHFAQGSLLQIVMFAAIGFFGGSMALAVNKAYKKRIDAIYNRTAIELYVKELLS